MIQFSCFCDVLLLMEIQNWKSKPAVSRATGLIMKLKSSSMICLMCFYGSFRMIHRMTPSFVIWNVTSEIFNFMWHSVANPCMSFLFDFIQLFSPFSWTQWLGKHHYAFFPKAMRVSHVVNACRGQTNIESDAASSHDG